LEYALKSVVSFNGFGYPPMLLRYMAKDELSGRGIVVLVRIPEMSISGALNL